MRNFVPKNARLIPDGAKRVFTGIIYDVYQWEQERFDGTSGTFEMLKRPDTCIIIPVKGEKIVAISDEQPGTPAHLTLPGGRNDVASEDELACAQRELLEETGLRFNTWKLVAAWQPARKIEYFVYVFVASDFAGEQAPRVDAGGEIIEPREMTFAEVKAAAANDPREFPEEVFARVHTLEELLALPDLR